MKSMMRILFHIAKADFNERTRRYSFLVTLGVLIYLAYLSIPPITAKYLVIGMGDYRGIYNSAWIGSSIALLCNTLLSLIGFYLINNSIKRDTITGVGQIIATTPLSKPAYLIGKMLSNLLFLMSMVAIISLVSIGMQLYRAESTSIELWSYLSPIIITTIPIMAMVSAVALLFESVKFLRSGFGNVLYYILYMVVLVVSLESGEAMMHKDVSAEPFGISVIIGSMQETAHSNYPDYTGAFSIGGGDVKDSVKTFEWNGVAWTTKNIFWRLFWVGISILMTMLVALLFKRFDETYEYIKKKTKPLIEKPKLEVDAYDASNIHLSPLEKSGSSALSKLFATTIAELKIMLKGLHKIWYLVALVLIIISITAPIKAAGPYIVPLSWVWPLLIWSKMGNRELYFRTNQFVFAVPNPVSGQLPAVWLAGFIVALATGIGWPLRMLFNGEFSLIISWLVGAAFIPSLALALGVWSKSSKMFEVVYFILWYIGPMNRTPALDYIGVNNQTPAIMGAFSLITIVLILLSAVGRIRQVNI